MRTCYRRHIQRAWRTTIRSVNRSCVRVRWRAPDDLRQSLTAFGRALRAHRRLAKLAPRFFDEAVIDREAFNRAEKRRWMATWEPALASVYGVEPVIPAPTDDLPPLPPLRTQRAVDYQLAALQLWMEIGRSAMERHQQRHPHAIPSFNHVIRLTELAIDFKKLALGLDSQNPLPEKFSYDYALTNLKRAYGHQNDRPPAVETAPASVPPPPTWPPPDTKRDIIQVKLVRSPHGLLTYEYPKPPSGP